MEKIILKNAFTITIFLLGTIVVSSCTKESDLTTESEIIVEPPIQPSASIEGTWVDTFDGGTDTYIFEAEQSSTDDYDGYVSHAVEYSNGSATSFTGLYKLSGNKIIFEWWYAAIDGKMEEMDEMETYSYSLNGNVLTITDSNGESYNYKKQ